jgi:uncharacterized protein YjiS (DUF1127 family)
MNATLQTIRHSTASLSQSRLARAYVWLKRSRASSWANFRASSRARRALCEVDARTLRDIGVTRRQRAVLAVTAGDR